MKKNMNKFNVVFLCVTLLFAFSCSDDKENTLNEDQGISSSEVKTIVEIDSQSSAIDQIITQLYNNDQSGKSTNQEDCYVTEYSDTGYVVTFDNCSVDGGEEINGTLSVTYKIGEEESAFTAMYANVSIGDIIINGFRDFTIVTTSDEGSIFFDIVSDMSIELEDGSVIEESGTKNFNIDIASENFQNSTLSLAGNWTVKADGNTYVVNITTPLITNFFSCEYISRGVMGLNKNGLGVAIDFGDGTCDDMATLTYPDGTQEEISLRDE